MHTTGLHACTAYVASLSSMLNTTYTALIIKELPCIEVQITFLNRSVITLLRLKTQFPYDLKYQKPFFLCGYLFSVVASAWRCLSAVSSLSSPQNIVNRCVCVSRFLYFNFRTLLCMCTTYNDRTHVHVANACRSIPSLVFFECSVRSSASIFFVLLEGVALQDDLLLSLRS